METEARLYASRAMAEAVIKDLDLVSNPAFTPPEDLLPVGKLPSDRELADAVDRTGRMLTVRRAPRAEFIDISVRSRSPDLAAKIANQYVSTLQETRLMERSKKQRKLVKALGAEVDRVHGELAQSEHAVADFRRSHGMLQGAAGPEELAQISRIAAEAASGGREKMGKGGKGLGGEVDGVHGGLGQSGHAVADFRRSHGMLQGAAGPEELAQISRIAAEAASAGSERADLAARSRGIGVAAALQSAATATSPLLQQQQRQYDDLLREKAKLSAFYGEGHPDLATVDAQISELRDNMGKERVRVAAAASVEASAESTRARSAASGAAAREAQLRSYLAAITGRAFANNQNNVTLMSLEREAETTRELYLSLVSRLKTETAALAGQGVTSSLLSRAPVPNEPVSPTPQTTITAALVEIGREHV